MVGIILLLLLITAAMFSWLGKQAGVGRARDGGAEDVVQTVTGGLKELYTKKLLPLEEHYRFHEFHSPALEEADFENKPMVLLVGQYSTGKTTFIRYEKGGAAAAHLEPAASQRRFPPPPPVGDARAYVAPPPSRPFRHCPAQPRRMAVRDRGGRLFFLFKSSYISSAGETFCIPPFFLPGVEGKHQRREISVCQVLREVKETCEGK